MFGLERLQAMMAEAQALNQTVTFETRHPNPGAVDRPVDEIRAAAEARFPDEWSAVSQGSYRLANLRTDLLTERVVRELADQATAGEVVLTNGCCTQPNCPTTVFYRSVLWAIGRREPR